MAGKVIKASGDSPLLAKRKEGMALVAMIRPRVLSFTVKTPEGYAAADGLLSEVRTKRKTWAERMADILTPLKESVNAAKRAFKSADELFDEVDQPLLELETHIKRQMSDFKLEEIRQIRAAEEERQQEEVRLRKVEADKKAAEGKAKTPAMAARIAVSRAEIQERLAALRNKDNAPTAVKAESSVARTSIKFRVVDINALMEQCMDDPELHSLLTIDMSQLSAKFKLESPVAESQWLQGVEVYENITIAGR